MRRLFKDLAIDILIGIVIMILSLLTVTWIMDANNLGEWHIQDSCIKYLSEE